MPAPRLIVGVNVMLSVLQSNFSWVWRWAPSTRLRLRLTPDRVLAGIVFHLLDEGLVASVDPQSVERTRGRIRWAGYRFSIGRGAWASMSNRQRLEWLLEQSSTKVVGWRGGTAFLEFAPAGGRDTPLATPA